MTVMPLRMAKASRKDLDAAAALVGAFETLRDGFEPGEYDNRFDEDDPASCQRVLRHLLGVCEQGSLLRVVWGMEVLLDPGNQVVDPDSSTLELHPRFAGVAAEPAADCGTASDEDGS